MPYMLMIIEPRGQRMQRTRQEGEACYARMVAFQDSLAARRLLKSGASLLTDDDAAKVQKRSGKLSFHDGPFAEAKEMVGGFFLVDCKTKDEALALAAECPAAEWATVEVRECGACFEGLV